MSKLLISVLLVFICYSENFAQSPITIDGDESDWSDVPVLITDPDEKQGQYTEQQNMLWSDQVDIKEVKFVIKGTDAYWFIRFWGSPAWPNNPDAVSSRGYYGLLLDLDNDVNTGWNTEFYEGQKIALGEKNINIGAELFLEIGLDTDEKAISYATCKLYYGGDFSQKKHHLPNRKQWGEETIIFEFPSREDKGGTFSPQLTSGTYTDPASGGQYTHAWGDDFVEVKQSLLPSIAYWQHKGFDYLQPGDKISLAAHVESNLDNWGDDFTDGAIFEMPDYTLTAGSITGGVKKAEDNSAFAGLKIQVYRKEKPVGRVTTDEAGRYYLALKPGGYIIEPTWGNITEPSKTTSIKIQSGKQVVVDFSVAKPKPPEILVRSAAVYQSLSSYKDTTTIYSQYVQPGSDSRSSIPVSFAYERPNRIRFEITIGGMMADMIPGMYCNGKSLLLYSNKTKEYTEKPAPPFLTFSEIKASLMMMARSMSVQKLMMSESPIDTLMKDVQRTNVYPSEELDGVPVIRVELIKPAGSFPRAVRHRLARVDMPVKMNIWIGKENHLIHKISYTMDMGKMADETPPSTRDRYAGMKITNAEIHSAIEVDSPLADDLFTFLPPRGAKLVEHFKNPMESQMRLSVFKGKPAPDFVLKDIKNNTMGLKDFKDKVCIVNFWATWCGPCRVEIPTFIALQKQYADKGFSMIGISLDEGPEVVATYAKENKVNYPMLMANKDVRAAYGGVMAVPSTFIIDKKGIIRETYLGVPADQLKFQREVEKLLAE